MNNDYLIYANGCSATSCKTETKNELSAWFAGLAVYLSTMFKKEEENNK